MHYSVIANGKLLDFNNPVAALNELRLITNNTRAGETKPLLMVFDPEPGEFEDDYIVIDRMKPEVNRFKEAYEVQNACNPHGVARLLVAALAQVSKSPGYNGTADLCKDPAIVAIVDKLNSMMSGDAFDALRKCRELGNIA